MNPSMKLIVSGLGSQSSICNLTSPDLLFRCLCRDITHTNQQTDTEDCCIVFIRHSAGKLYHYIVSTVMMLNFQSTSI